MSASRWFISLLLAGHVVALTIEAIPPPDSAAASPEVRSPTRNAVAAALTPPLDASIPTVHQLHQLAWDGTAWARGPATWYVGLTGLGQSWRMFMDPPKYDEYLQVRYYVVNADSQAGGRIARTAGELAFPAHREDRVRVFQSFRDSYTDKAIAMAIADSMGQRRNRDEAAIGDADAPEPLSAVAKFFSQRFAARHLMPGEAISRTEIWIARAGNRPPGSPEQPAAIRARRAVLEQYYVGPVENGPSGGQLPRNGDVFQEADLTWVLEYIHP